MLNKIVMLVVFFLFECFPESLWADSSLESRYTSLKEKDCHITSQQSPNHTKSECKGISEFNVIITDGDSRQDLTLITPTKKELNLNFFQNVSTAFSNFGDKIEWLIKKNSSSLPVAFIVRYNVNELADKPNKTTSYLVVAKINESESCIVAVISPSKNANQIARKKANQATELKCIKKMN